MPSLPYILKKVEDKCEKQQKNCLIQPKPKPPGSIKLEDGSSRKLTINNPGDKSYRQILVDGCLIKSGTADERCDWMIYDIESEMLCLVELKSSVGESDLKKAHAQFEGTIRFLKLQNYTNLKLILVFREFSSKTARLEFKKGPSEKYLSKKYWDKFFTYSKENYPGNPKQVVVKNYGDIFPPINSSSKPKP